MELDVVLGLSLALAGLLGFAAHRASICTVRAVVEVVSTGRAHLFASFLKTALWVIAVTAPLTLLSGGVSAFGDAWAVSTVTLLGGFAFGVGAALNRGCAFSTLSRLGDGQVAMLLTLLGMGLGTYAYSEAARTLQLPPGRLVDGALQAGNWWLFVLATGVWLWATREIVRLWRSRPAGKTLPQLIMSNRYRLSTAAALIGVSNGVLYALHGPWAYTGLVREVAGRATVVAGDGLALRGALLIAVVAGVALSSWQRRSFHLQWRPALSWWFNLLGGGLMGAGSVMARGGNDVLVLHTLPGLSPHAPSAYLSMVIGILIPAVLMRRWRGEPMRVDCGGDLCRAAGAHQPGPDARGHGAGRNTAGPQPATGSVEEHQA